MTPTEFREFLKVAKEEKVKAFEIGDLKVTFSDVALLPDLPKINLDQAVTKKDTDKPIWRGYTERDLTP